MAALAGFSGLTLSAPDMIARLVRAAPPPPSLVLTNDPYAGGVALDHVFLLARGTSRSVVAALAFRDFGAMRKDVFRHRAETFHEGLSLSLLAIDWNGPERDIVLGVIAANVRDGTAARDVIDRVARATLSACTAPDAAAMQLATLPAISGHAESRAIVANSNDAAVDVALDARNGAWSLHASFDSTSAMAVGRCSAAAVRSASTLGVADALSLPAAAVLPTLRVEDTNVAAVAPEAVGDGAPLAYACYRAAFAAARKLSGGTSEPRDEAAFKTRQ
jgi:hypothetical protein